MVVTHTIADCRRERAKLGAVALVPTMGALHSGHIALMEIAHRHAAQVAVSIFVNPTQFGAGEDFSKYPRPLEADLEMCRAAGVDLVFNPTAEEMYPDRDAGRLVFRDSDKAGAVAPESPAASVVVDLPQLSGVLEGRFRPGHFEGVCQVVAKLFNIVQPAAACFGQKDYQQLRILCRMVEELNWPIEMIACPTMRDPDGMAISSRNRYLTLAQRQRGLAVSRGLFAARKEFEAGVRQANKLVTTVQNILLEGGVAGSGAAGIAPAPLLIDYVAAVDAMTLKTVAAITSATVLAVAVRVGTTRLIDNVVLRP